MQNRRIEDQFDLGMTKDEYRFYFQMVNEIFGTNHEQEWIKQQMKERGWFRPILIQ